MDEEIGSDEPAQRARTGRDDPAKSSWNDVWVDDVPMYRLWFEFMLFSPSYELARRSRADELTPADEAILPTDFTTVVATYDDFGDLTKLTFRDWWVKKAKPFFGAKGSTPFVIYGGHTHVDHADEHHLYKDHDAFRAARMREDEQGWARETSRTLHFSTALKRKDVLRAIKAELGKLEFEQLPDGDHKPKYPMQKIGKMRSALEKYLRTLKNRAKYPDEELWSIGVRSNMTAAAMNWPQTNSTPDRLDEKSRQAMAIATSRALLRARMISENAARGQFPVHTRLKTALEFIPVNLSRCGAIIEDLREQESIAAEVNRKKIRALMIQYKVTLKGRYLPEDGIPGALAHFDKY